MAMTEVFSYGVPDLMGWDQVATSAANMTYQMLSKYDNRFSYTAGTTTIIVNNKFNISVAAYGRSQRFYVNLSISAVDNPSTVLSTGAYLYTTWNHRSGGWNVTLYRTDDTYYLSIRPVDGTGENGQLGGVIYWHIDSQGHDYFGMLGNTDKTSTLYTSWSIESMNILCVDNGITNYQVKKLANYKLNNFDLFFAPMSILVSSTGDFSKLDSFCSCSNVTYRNTISTNNKNYYAVGTNTLIELPEEES